MDNRFDFDTPHYESPEQEQADILSWLADDDAQERNQKKLAETSEKAVEALRVVKRRVAAMGSSFSDDDRPFKTDDDSYSDLVKMAVQKTMRRARNRLGIKSDAMLAEELGMSLDQLNRRKANPGMFDADEARRLCELAHVTLGEARGETANTEGMASIAYLMTSDQWSPEDVVSVFESADDDTQMAVVYALRSWLRNVFKA